MTTTEHPAGSRGGLAAGGPALEHATVQLSEVKCHYVSAGEGPTVLLVHGWLQTWYEWRHVIDLLAADHRVIAVDLRGFGYSSKPAAGYDALRMAADLRELIEHLDLRGVTVYGHDWGAVFAYALARTCPERVSALGIVEMALPGVGVMEPAMVPAAGGNYLWHMGFQSVPDIPELLITGKERPYLQWFFERFAYDPAAITPSDLDEYVAAVSQVGALRSGLAVYQAYFTSAEQVAELARTPLEIPVSAHGGASCLGGMTLASVQPVAPGATGGVIERCGHWAAEERPEVVADLVRDLVLAASEG